LIWASVAYANEVTSVTARQRWPWNGLVDIDYVVEGTDVAGTILALVRSKGEERGLTALTGDVSAVAGMHRMTWDSAAGWPELDGDDVCFQVEVFPSTVSLTFHQGALPRIIR